ncbi:restriction endonuclease subunit S [Stutzerimonas stutzeri]|uniref:restriction endonuclease subunit S n=1 Tax=Stutzerimonas stutzeri TaxID=316 RepID=UPI00210CB4AB|nr:restriction endonuclease subunit S [Stutzerimonas stutzeri]MCQ4320765.1 restriction endonuclease subunit S [Stutzerimonas stutzeri]
MSELPAGWAEACISDLADLNPKQAFDDETVAGFVPMSHAPTTFRGKLRFDERPWGEIKKAYTNFKDGDVIFAKVTPCFENGKAAHVEGLPNGIGAGSSEFFVLRRTCADVSAKYLLALVKSHNFLREGAENMTGAVGLRRVPKQFVESYPVKVPPAAEQARIAAKLDELLAQVDTLKARIDGIPALHKRFRQSVLAAAVCGRLTEEWRDNDEYINTHTELQIPNSWKWLSVGHLTEVKGGKRLPKGEELTPDNTGHPYIRAGQLKDGTVSTEGQLFVPSHVHPKISKYIVNSGDVYITIVGACIGDAGVIPHRCDGFNLTENAAKICNFKTSLNSDYLAAWLRSQYLQELIRHEIKSGAQGKLALKRIKELPVPYPPFEEQTEIVRRVEQLFAFADQLEARVKAAQARIDHLTQSILAKAFRGELVPQDPDDEPASVLLDRIKAQRAAAPKAKRGRRAAMPS